MQRRTATIALDCVSKRFGENTVLTDINLEFLPGTCTTLVGENGAGKSTLIGIMSGKLQATEGRLLIDGEPVEFGSPRDARRFGIAVIPQELAYAPDLTVGENIMLANWPSGKLFTTRRWVEQEARQILEHLEMPLDVRALMSELTLAERQLVEIAKAITRDAAVLILDEPTASLHNDDSALLIERLRRLKASGVAIVYVSHDLEECFSISEHVAVLRNGRVQSWLPVGQTSIAQTVSTMLGSEYVHQPRKVVASVETSTVLAVNDWATSPSNPQNTISFEVRSGEVLGVYGLLGSGAEAVARGLGGHVTMRHGNIEHAGAPRSNPRSAMDARSLGIAYVPAERKSDGMAANQPVLEQITAMIPDRFSRFGFLLRRRQTQIAGELVERFRIRAASVVQEMGELSGGNQQKTILASRVTSEPAILLLHEPTRGVDIGSRAQIHQIVLDYARANHAVVIVTTDPHEAVQATDRLIVMRDGLVVATLEGDDRTSETALSLAAGGSDV